ncbi:MAG: hypothetical protein AB1938_29835 [Myxococcota bacterium]
MWRASTVLLAACLAGCLAETLPDGGDPADGGADAGPVDAGHDAGRPRPDASAPLYDGGLLIYGGGCVSPDRNKFIAILDSRDPWRCAYVSFRRWDGGFPTLFPNLRGPEDFKVDDARWDTCNDLELPTSLNQNSLPVEDMWGALDFTFVFEGRPRVYSFDGGIQMGYHVFRVNVSAGCPRDCKGN